MDFSVLLRGGLTAWLLSLGLAAAPAVAQPPPGFQPPVLFEPALPTRAAPGPARYPGDVAYLPDISYKSVAGYRPLKLDLYLPPPAARPHPLVLWIHGGGFELGNPRADWTWGDWRPVLAELAARGYAVAAVSYRLSAEAPFPAALDDVQDALRFLRAHADQWNLDRRRAVAWGLSAGGGLAALMGTAACSGDACVQGVVDWFGPTDFDAAMAATPQIRRFLGCGEAVCTPAQREAASALRQVRAGLPPYLIVQGEADPLVTPAHSVRLAQALRHAGGSAELIVYAGLGHGFDGASPARLREILLQTFEGIDRLAGAQSR